MLYGIGHGFESIEIRCIRQRDDRFGISASIARDAPGTAMAVRRGADLPPAIPGTRCHCRNRGLPLESSDARATGLYNSHRFDTSARWRNGKAMPY